MLVSLYDVISYDVINVKNFREMLMYPKCWDTLYPPYYCSHFHALIKHKLVYFLVWFLLGIYFLILIGLISLFMNADWLIQGKVAQGRFDIYVSSWTNFSTYQSTRGQDFPAVFMNI